MKAEQTRFSRLNEAFTALDRRYAERVPVHMKVMYSCETGPRLMKAEGSLINLCKTGCKILVSTPPPAGTRITLFLYIPDGMPPLCLTGTSVTWVAGTTFAARFPKLTDEERKRVQMMIWKHATLTKAKQPRTAFRFA